MQLVNLKLEDLLFGDTFLEHQLSYLFADLVKLLECKRKLPFFNQDFSVSWVLVAS